MAYSQLGPDLFVHHGEVNVGILRDGSRACLIDCGDGDVQHTLQELGMAYVEAVLFTHHHRDQASGIYGLVETGTRVVVPAKEQAWFANVEKVWNDPAWRWHLYDFHPHNLMLAQSVPVHQVCQKGDTFSWGRMNVSVFETPGHTEGSVSYLVNDKQDTTGYLFCGDTIYALGQIYDLYSLQKGWETRDYHGFLGNRKRLISSLREIQVVEPIALVPSHGNTITHPGRAVDLLISRLEQCYEQYAAISALRFYFPEMFADYEGRPGTMPVGTSKPTPGFVTHIGTTWIISSQNGAAFVLDCGTERVIHHLRHIQARGQLGTVEGLWITHYHDDHVDAIPQFQETFNCPVIADEHVAQVVENPLAWRLPCISPARIQVDHHTVHGESWAWREFIFTAYHLPGQTYYHGGLLVEGRGARIFFVGDSFTPSGIDDYCAGNRNILGESQGFDACLRLVQQIAPEMLLNSHVDTGFSFTPQDCALMRANLAKREQSYGDLFPWDNVNYGIDEHWVRCHPYEQHISPGARVQIDTIITNYTDHLCAARCRPILPPQWQIGVAAGEATIAPQSQERITLMFSVPHDAAPGRWVVPIDVTYDGRRLGQFREAIVVIKNDRERVTQ